MPRTITNKFNRGEIDERALVRDDVEEVHNTCELMENWLPRRGGWMQYRPGTEALGACKTAANHRIIPFVDDGDVPTLLEFSSSSANPSSEVVRIWSNDALLEVTATADTITNDDFAANITGWSDDSDGAGATTWSSLHGGSARITGGPSAGDSGALYQTVTTTAGERTLELFIEEAQMLLQIGTSGARSNDIFEGLLSTGYHMITFTADGSNVTYTVSNTNAYYGYLQYLQYKATGTFELEAPFFTSTDTLGTTLDTVRYTQINDVLFLTSSGYYLEGYAWPLINVRRWSTKSWSFELPEITDGPFGFLNDSPITLTPSTKTGNGNLTASNDFFTDPGHVGRKYKLVHGDTEGICEILTVTSPTVATMRVLRPFGSSGGKAATRDWYEGRLAYYLPSPTTVDVYQNRLWLAGGARIYGSVSDLFLSFDETIEGNSAAIQKTIALGPVQEISWLAGGDELFIGLTAEEMRVTSTADYEAVTQNNITLRRGTNRGSKNVQSVIVNGLVYFIQRSGKKLLSMTGLRGEEAVTQDTTVLHPTITEAGIKRIAYTAEPEPRMYVLLEDGTLRCMLFDNVENITAWSRITIGGGATVVDIATVPSGGDDQIYIIVDRSGISRSIEHFVDEDTALGQSDSRHFDSHMYFTSPGGSVSGLDHLEGVVADIWADGQPRGRSQVAGGIVALDETVWTDVVVGVRHTAKWKSNRLARYIDESVFNYRKRIAQIGLIARDFAIRTFKYGPDESNLYDMPDIEDGRPRPPTDDPYPTITDTLLGTLEGNMDTTDLTLYGDYIIAACDSIPSPPDVRRDQFMEYNPVDGHVYILGGLSTGGTASKQAWKYDPVNETLTQLADIDKILGSSGLVEHDVTYHQGYMFFFNAYSQYEWGVYEIATDTWLDPTTTPSTDDTPGYTVQNYPCMAAYDGDVYYFGGQTASYPSNNFWKYDISTDTHIDESLSASGTTLWHDKSAMVAPQSGSGAGNLYMFGGRECATAPPAATAYSSAFYEYDISLQTWSGLSETGQTAKLNPGMASADDDFLYQFGGDEGSLTYDDVMRIYDIDAGSWSFTLSTPDGINHPYGKKQFGMTGDSDRLKVYIHGGVQVAPSYPTYRKDFWEWDIAGSSWTLVTTEIAPAAGGARTFNKADPEVLTTADYLNIESGSDDIRAYAVTVDQARGIAFYMGIEDDDATINKVVASVDISDPDNISQLGYLEGGTNVVTNNKGLAFDGRYLFLTSFVDLAKLYAIDTADPANMVNVGNVTLTYGTNAPQPERMVYDSGYVYIAWEDDIHVIDVSDPNNMSVVSTDPVDVNSGARVLASWCEFIVQDGSYMVTANPVNHSIQIYRKLSPVSLEYLGGLSDSTNLNTMVDVNIFWPYIYVATATLTSVIDATNPASPSIIATYQGYTDVTSMVGQSPGLFFSGSTTSSGQIYASDVRSWELIDYDEPSFEFPGEFDTDTRLYFECTGPATILQVSYEIEDIDYPQRGSDGSNQP